MDMKTALDDLIQSATGFAETRSGLLEEAVVACVASLVGGGKILVFGNGGSAAEAQHFAAEMVNRFMKDRPAIPAVALTADVSCLTSIGNDSDFAAVFSRQIEALGKPGDVALGLTTSGNSPNILAAFRSAKKAGLATIALTGEGGGRLVADPDTRPDILLDVPSRSTPRIQEVHLLILHLLAGAVESRLTS
ncbi:MAG: SIS domain-containing protein [Acidobacteriota bacterium]|nr:SIS domain-containing protein [Acidobacteriota bacterium]